MLIPSLSLQLLLGFGGQIYQQAEDALQHLFFIGLQEEFQLSSELLLRELGMADKLPQPEIKKERDQSTGKTSEQKAAIKADQELMRLAREVNQYDLRLYKKGKIRGWRELVCVFLQGCCHSSDSCGMYQSCPFHFVDTHTHRCLLPFISRTLIDLWAVTSSDGAVLRDRSEIPGPGGPDSGWKQSAVRIVGALAGAYMKVWRRLVLH